ncbi:MAG: alpha/beta hydrolase [Sphingomonadaceae bacterium]|nr:MAG: alpha/beta hydrolase [Sphingomonadaceae bacterium]
MTEPRFHTMPDGRRIAFRHAAGAGPALVFLPGYMSDMDGGKATALFAWAQAQGRACLLLDYSGCGRSDGAFADGTLSRWRDEVLALIDAQIEGPVILVGSSMGGWLNLLVGLELGERLAGLVGIASAPDFTDWGRSDEDKAKLRAGETVFDPNPYGSEPTPMYPGFFTDAETQRLLDGSIGLACPVRLIHGQRDADVPWRITLRLAEALASEDVVVTLVKDGDHRLSRPQDVDRLISLMENIA